jgi:coiled-coil domain-containing protein 55
VYDAIKKKEKGASRVRKDASREPKYMAALLEKAKERELDYDVYYERKVQREAAEDAEQFGEKEKFITTAYRKQLEETKRWKADQVGRRAPSSPWLTARAGR